MFIITTDHAGIPDIVEDGVNGIVIDVSKIDMQKVYQKLLNMTQEMFLRIEKENREKVYRHYTQCYYIQNMEKTMQEILTEE